MRRQLHAAWTRASCDLRATLRRRLRSRSGAWNDADRRPRHAAFGVRPVLHLTGELAACRSDVVTARAADRRDLAGLLEHRRERRDALRRGADQARLGERIERNQVELARQLAAAGAR